MLHRLWLTHPKMTVAVGVDEDLIIVEAAPIVGRFVGQPITNLTNWLNAMGPGLEVEEL
jgi:hypothetical protein